jgi:hypothetical protein
MHQHIPTFPQAVPYIHSVRLFTSRPRELGDVKAELDRAGVGSSGWNRVIRDGYWVGSTVWCNGIPEDAFNVLDDWEHKLPAVVSRWDLAVDWPGNIIERQTRHRWLAYHMLLKDRRGSSGRVKRYGLAARSWR